RQARERSSPRWSAVSQPVTLPKRSLQLFQVPPRPSFETVLSPWVRTSFYFRPKPTSRLREPTITFRKKNETRRPPTPRASSLRARHRDAPRHLHDAFFGGDALRCCRTGPHHGAARGHAGRC